MKKTPALLIVAVVAVSLLLTLACGPESKPAPPPSTAQPAPKSVPAPSSAPATPTPATATGKPPLVTWGTYDIGSGGYSYMSWVGEGILEQFGTKVRVVPIGTGIARHGMLRSGDINAVGSGGDMIDCVEGESVFAEMDWGPQALQVVWMAEHPGATVFFRKDSGMKTLADLKGKKVPYLLGSPAIVKQMEAHLAFANLTWNDVKKVEFGSYGATTTALIAGNVDCATAGPASPQILELDATPHRSAYFPLPQNDKEGWARLKKVCPDWVPAMRTIGAGLSEQNPLEGATYAYPCMAVYDWTNENLCYWMTKMIHESYAKFAPKDQTVKAYWPLEKSLALWDGTPYPFHNGSIRYLKEIGAWSPARENLQKQKLERQKALKDLWNTSKNEAIDQKMPSTKFAAFWMKKKEQASLPQIKYLK